ncbi:MAG: DNA polymerase IV [Candidatus Aenigmarchaeota archaeon]|nr:DNA polymerase IV [Candidatus Aenigmarchaeota archaeon]
MERIIMHVDLDAFFPSCEQRENPALKDKPVIVGADPKQGSGRGVVSSASYEARKFGVKSAMPISRAFRLCPDGFYIRPNFELYERISASVMEILKKHADKFQQAGIDEAFLDVSSSGSYGKAAKIANGLKNEIREKERVTASIGIAPNRAVAKIASDENKPDGLTVVKPGKVREFLYPKSVRKLWGVGPKTETLLNQLDIKTIKDLAEADTKKLKGKLGNMAEFFQFLANGIDESPVEEVHEIKSFNREHTFEEDTDRRADILSTIKTLVHDIGGQLKQNEATFKTVTLKIRFSNFETYTRAKSLPVNMDDEKTILRSANSLAEEFLKTGRKIRLVGVRVSNLKFGPTQKKLSDI